MALFYLLLETIQPSSENFFRQPRVLQKMVILIKMGHPVYIDICVRVRVCVCNNIFKYQEVEKRKGAVDELRVKISLHKLRQVRYPS